MDKKEWLPHLTDENVNEAKRGGLGAYLVALEGWRRGLTLTWYAKRVRKKSVEGPYSERKYSRA